MNFKFNCLQFDDGLKITATATTVTTATAATITTAIATTVTTAASEKITTATAATIPRTTTTQVIPRSLAFGGRQQQLQQQQ